MLSLNELEYYAMNVCNSNELDYVNDSSEVDRIEKEVQEELEQDQE